MREFVYAVTEEEEGWKVERVLSSRLLLSRKRISSLKFSGGIFLCGMNTHTDRRVKEGDTVSVFLPDGEDLPKPFFLPLDIAYEDEDLLVISKPAPLPSVRSSLPDPHTLENAVYAYLGCPDTFTFRPVNRLDKGTSGLMVCAKNAHAQYLLQKTLHTPSFIRKYLAVTDGAPAEDEGEIHLPIARSGEGTRRHISEDGKMSVTRYRMLEKNERHALLLLELETGRTHQIRVHMQATGCPVTGDYLYGTEHPLLPGRFALHSCYVSFIHPVTGKNVELESPLPGELRQVFEET